MSEKIGSTQFFSVKKEPEIRVKDAATGFVNRVNELSGVSGATLVTFNGEYMS